jgi:hypothetical protein
MCLQCSESTGEVRFCGTGREGAVHTSYYRCIHICMRVGSKHVRQCTRAPVQAGFLTHVSHASKQWQGYIWMNGCDGWMRQHDTCIVSEDRFYVCVREREGEGERKEEKNMVRQTIGKREKEVRCIFLSLLVF